MTSSSKTATAERAAELQHIARYLERRGASKLISILHGVPEVPPERLQVDLQTLRGWGIACYNPHDRIWMLADPRWETEIESRIRVDASPAAKTVRDKERREARERIVECLKDGRPRSLAELSEVAGFDLCDANLACLVKRSVLVCDVRGGVRYYRLRTHEPMTTLADITSSMAILGSGGLMPA